MPKVSSMKRKQTLLCHNSKLCFTWVCLPGPPTFFDTCLAPDTDTSTMGMCLHILSAALYGTYLINSAVKVAWSERCAFACQSSSPINKQNMPSKAVESCVSIVREYSHSLLDCLFSWYHSAFVVSPFCVP